jgi:putative ABC transport system permease protein
MNPSELIGMALKTVTASWMRTLLTMLGVIIGVASVVTLVSIGRGTTAKIEKQYENLGTNLLTVNILGQGRATQLDYDEVMQYEQFPEFNFIAPAVNGSSNVKFDRTQQSYTVIGTNDRFSSINKTDLASGRFLSESDLSFRTNVAVVGSTVVTELFGSANPIDQKINIKGYEFTVIGTLKTKGTSVGGVSVDTSIIVPLPTAQRQLGLGNIRTTYIEAANSRARTVSVC